jgi:hypothetical protein
LVRILTDGVGHHSDPNSLLPLQIFKEQMPADFYRLEPFHPWFVPLEMTKRDRSDRNLNFQPGAYPKSVVFRSFFGLAED